MIHRAFKVLSTPFRRRRMLEFEKRFLANRTVGQILDVGGAPGNWQLIESRPSVLLLNIGPAPSDLDGQFDYVQGDGCDLPFEDKSFELVYSNSVIEHLGTWERQQEFANEIRRVGNSYCVQTPNKSFPVEPHYLTPGIHYLPKRWRTRMLRNLSVWGWMTRPNRHQCEQMVDEIRLLSRLELAKLFPEASIDEEKVLGLTKSLTAAHQHQEMAGT